MSHHYFCVREANWHEGEDWYFYIPYNDILESSFYTFSEILKCSEFFQLCDTNLSEDEVDFLISRNKFNGGGRYMKEHNKCEIVVLETDMAKFNNKYKEEGDNTTNALVDIWYKGYIKSYRWLQDEL